MFPVLFGLPNTKEDEPMKSRREKEIALVTSGIILGTIIVAPSAGAAITAQQSSPQQAGMLMTL